MNSNAIKIDAKHMIIFTDGGAINNCKGAPGGSGVLFVNNLMLLGCSKYGTNNIRELDAIRYALYCLNKNFHEFSKLFDQKHVTIFSDSEYSINVITGNMKAKANRELITKCKYYINELKLKGIEIKFEHVMAHTNNIDDISFCNSIVDRVANSEAKELMNTKDEKVWHLVKLTTDEYSRLTKINSIK